MASQLPSVKTVDMLCEWASEQGVALTLFELSPTVWEIHHIEREDEASPGAGRRVIERVKQEAQSKGCAVSLMVVGLNSVLMDYYGQLGFKPLGEPDEETGDQAFQWEPQVVVAPPTPRTRTARP